MRKVYVVNRNSPSATGHDFSPALHFGEIHFLSEGVMNRYSCNNMHREFSLKMRGSHEDDYIVPCSLNVMNSIACALFAVKHKRLNLLLYKQGKYIERNLVFGEGGETDV